MGCAGSKAPNGGGAAAVQNPLAQEPGALVSAQGWDAAASATGHTPPPPPAAAAAAEPPPPAERSVPAVEGYDTMGMSADLVEAILHMLAPELVSAAKERSVRALLQASGAIAAGDFTSAITAHSSRRTRRRRAR